MTSIYYYCPQCPWEGGIEQCTEGSGVCPECLCDLHNYDGDDDE